MATDKRLDQVSTLTDFDYALIVKGGQVAKASKQQLAELVGNLLYGATNASSLATVVAGQMVTSNLFPFALRVSEPDANECVESGIYRIAFMGNVPVNYGLLIVFSDSNYTFQIVTSVTGHSYYLRYKNESGWGSWCNISVNV